MLSETQLATGKSLGAETDSGQLALPCVVTECSVVLAAMGTHLYRRCVLCEATRCVKVPIRTIGNEIGREDLNSALSCLHCLHVQAVAVRKMGNQSEDGGQLHLQAFMCQQLLTRVEQANNKTYRADLGSTALNE